MKRQRILVAVDLSDPSLRAWHHARTLAKRMEASLLLLWVEPEAGHTPHGAAIYSTALREVTELLRELRVETQSRLSALLEEWEADGGTGEVMVEHGVPAEVIAEVAAREGVELVVMGTKGHTGFKRFFLGSVASKVVRTSRVPVMVVRGASEDFHRILVATDFSPSSERALALVVAGASPGAEIDVCHVWHYPAGLVGRANAAAENELLTQVRDELQARATARGEALLDRYQSEHVSMRLLLEHGQPAARLHEILDAGSYDLVALGTHGYRGLQRFLLGSVAESTVRHAPCSVLVAREGVDAD